MGEAIITRRYGALNLSETVYAAISVSYTPGWICTCSCGDIFFAASDTSGGAIFSIPSQGDWTVTATNPTDASKTASKVVQVRKSEIYYVTIGLGLQLFTPDGVNSNYSATFMTMHGLESEGNGDASGPSGELRSENGAQYIWVENCNWSKPIIYFKPALTSSQLNGFSKLVVSGRREADAGGTLSSLNVGLTRNIPANTNDNIPYVVSVTIPHTGSDTTVSVDLDTIDKTKSHYVVISAHYMAPGRINSISLS